MKVNTQNATAALRVPTHQRGEAKLKSKETHTISTTTLKKHHRKGRCLRHCHHPKSNANTPRKKIKISYGATGRMHLEANTCNPKGNARNENACITAATNIKRPLPIKKSKISYCATGETHLEANTCSPKKPTIPKNPLSGKHKSIR